jgi:GntR family transcriptional regulator, rspAB operon transcriptional repressor
MTLSSPHTLRQQAYEEIKRGILDSRYAPGSLLSENQLAEELQIGRTPIREALRDLATGGLVRILPQRGIIVSELSLQDIVEVYQLREQLEGFAVRLAAERMSEEDRTGFEDDHQRALVHRNAGRQRQGYDFSILMHDRIIRIARNARLSKFMGQLSDLTHRFGLLTLRNGRGQPALREHGEIIAALLVGDAERAETLMRTHLRADRNMVLRLTLPAGIAGSGFAS